MSVIVLVSNMQKRIYFTMLAGILLAVLLLATVFSYFFFSATRNQEIAAIQDKTYLIAEILNYESSTIPEVLNAPFEGSRITVISADGTVLLDSHAISEHLGGRYDREEFQAALRYGTGEAIRQSTVFQAETYYYALLLNGGNVLRISRSLSSLGGAFITILPALLAVLGLSFVLTYIAAQKQSEVQKAQRQRHEFSANVSHELKTPLTTISALSEMMANGMAKPEDFTNFADKISKQSKRLIAIVEDIIRLSEFDEKKVKRTYTSFDVQALAVSVIESLEEHAQKKSISLNLSKNTVMLRANERLVEELLFNLVENGIKYNKEGGHVSLNISIEDKLCKITASDTGIGIPKADQKRIFERFYRVDNSRARNTGGTGLGLSIVKHIVEHHKGKVTIDSAPDIGTNITCYFPL